MSKLDDIRFAAESDLLTFIKVVAPHRVLGSVHEDIIRWWYREDRRDHQIVLIPRDHQKSALVAYRVAYELTKEPWRTFLYLSATSNLAEKQLRFIKDIMTSKTYRMLWPEMVNANDHDREKWAEKEIMVDHPIRRAEGVRDPSIFAAGLTTTVTGLHFTNAVLDDVVVLENAYTQEGRDKVSTAFSLLSSVETVGAEEWVVGTRYDPRDLYGTLVELEEDVYNEDGDIVESRPVYEVWQEQVEDRGDGTGEFLWPRQQRGDGRWFGFNQEVLARKRAKYVDKTQFYAQYYNNPNDPSGHGIKQDRFQYYNKGKLINEDGDWYYDGAKINIVAAMDFAYSLKRKADYTAIVVVGIDSLHNYYVLDIDRFKTDSISEYFDHLFKLHTKWGFRKVRAEITAAQQAIVRSIKEDHIKPKGLRLVVDEHRPSPHEGSKEERMMATLWPLYENMQVWHYRGGNCQILEEELTMARPPHDDVKDALTAAVDIAVAPSRRVITKNRNQFVESHNRFGGIRV